MNKLKENLWGLVVIIGVIVTGYSLLSKRLVNYDCTTGSRGMCWYSEWYIYLWAVGFALIMIGFYLSHKK